MPNSIFWQERCEGRSTVLGNKGVSTSNSEKYKHTQQYMINKEMGREGMNLQGYFL
jgi:hypothetical protein